MTLTRDEIRRRKRLTWAIKNPRLALDNGWVEDPKFCLGFFDRCDQLAFVQSREVLTVARRAVEIADAHGDPHLLNRSHGVLCHAYVVERDLYWAARTLEAVREQALACCAPCRVEHLRRLGDLLGEERRLDESLAALDRALEEGRDLDADTRGHIHYARGVTHHLRGDRDRALDDAEATLELVSLSAPHGFAVDTAAFVPIYVAGGDPRHDARGSAMLAAFDRRLDGARGWGDWLTRRTWAEAHLKARLGEFRAAFTLIERARVRLLADGLPREAVAATLDAGQLRCRAGLPVPVNWRAAIDLTQSCLDRRTDLAADHREGLGEILSVLETHPECAFDQMVQLRDSFIAPVPGVMAERIG